MKQSFYQRFSRNNSHQEKCIINVVLIQILKKTKRNTHPEQEIGTTSRSSHSGDILQF